MKNTTLSLRLIISVFFISFCSFILAQSQFKVVGYLPTWAGYPNSINNVQLTKLTHINIAFANPDVNANLTGGGTTANIATVVNAAYAKNVKVLMSIGGGSAPAATYKSVITNNQTTFVNNIVQYAVSNNLDGIDVDIEGNVLDGTSLTATQYQSFVTQLATSLHAQNKIMTAALADWFGNYVTNTAASKFDFINIMSYDSTGSPWGAAGQHSTYALALTNFNYWKTTKAVPASKLNIGVPFYGYCWGTYNTANADAMSYCAIVTKYPGTENNDQIGSGANLISYNGIPTIKKKASYAFQHAGGIMIWEVTQDCSGSKSLLTAIDTTIKAITTSIHNVDLADFNFEIFPNPASEEAVVSYQLADNADVKITIADLLGKEVMQVTNEKQNAGEHQRNINTEQLQNGIYFVEMNFNGRQLTQKLVIERP